MSVVVQCFRLIKKKYLTSYSLLILIWLLAQLEYLMASNIISSKKRHFKAIGRFTQPLFHEWCFPLISKTAKLVPLFKKDSKLHYSNYRLISLLSNIEKIQEKPLYKKDFIPLSITIILSITHSLVSDSISDISCFKS